MNKYVRYPIVMVIFAILASACGVAIGTPPPVGATSTPVVAVIGTYTPATKTSADATFEAIQTGEAQTAMAPTATPVIVTKVVTQVVVQSPTPNPTGTPAATSTSVPAALTLANSAQVSTTQTVSNTSNMADAANCPTRREVNDMLFGLDANGKSQDRVVQVSSESGAWQVNTGSPKFTYTVTLTGTGMIATIHDPKKDKAELWTADGSKHTIFRGTFRYAGCYDPKDDMNQPDAAVRILVKENTDGTYQDWFNNRRPEDWQYSVVAGNFQCPKGICPTANVSNNDVSARTTAVPASCPTFGGVQTLPGNDGAPYCKLQNATVVTDKVPANWKVEYWNGSAVANATAGDTITTGDATFRPLP